MEYSRYHIPSEPALPVADHPDRFVVRVGRPGLAKLLLGELIRQKGNMAVVTSRPCMYGVFSGPIGGFAPRPKLCVGCLRCTVEYPDFVQVRPNPARLRLGDSYFDPDKVDAIQYEAATGRVPVRGAGYRGAFSGKGWDSLWTDMSEIVRPTRDGIHGRETISTSVDLGEKPDFLSFDASGKPLGEIPLTVSLEVPWLFDPPPLSVCSELVFSAYLKAAEVIRSLAIVPMRWVVRLGSGSSALAPLVRPGEVEGLLNLAAEPTLIELDGWDEAAYGFLRTRFERSPVFVRVSMSSDIHPLVEKGIRLFHLTADYHGLAEGGFALEQIRAAHERLVDLGLREQVTLIGGGGVIAAEHVPKSILVGLDAVALDTPLLIALQGRFLGEIVRSETAQMVMPRMKPDWAVQRLVNLSASWRDQLLEVLGAMGLREVRRLRGEMGRAMFRHDLEEEAFAGVAGFEGDHVHEG